MSKGEAAAAAAPAHGTHAAVLAAKGSTGTHAAALATKGSTAADAAAQAAAGHAVAAHAVTVHEVVSQPVIHTSFTQELQTWAINWEPVVAILFFVAIIVVIAAVA